MSGRQENPKGPRTLSTEADDLTGGHGEAEYAQDLLQVLADFMCGFVHGV